MNGDVRAADVERLKVTFYRHFDRSRCEVLLNKSDQELDRTLDLLGEGTHFRAWRIKSRSPSAMEFVFKRATLGLGALDSVARQRWRSAIVRLSGLGSLIPPFELLESDQALALVMPYGDQTFDSAARHWHPMADRLDELRSALAGRGLELMDVPQGRCWSTVPFLFDLSDVRLTSDR